MADVWKAYEFLNNHLNLNLSEDDRGGVEMAFKKEWMKNRDYDAKASENVNDWEFFTYLVPRSKKKLDS